MSLPSQEVLDDIKDLISEITGFKEDDENFAICERYCLSHVLHHTYPFVNRTTVKNLVNSYVSRFYGHGYFKVSQELNSQVKSFLSNEKLFEKNPQYDIQWCLLSLVSSLSSNLTLVKDIPELLPVDDEESELEDFDWKEYLLCDLPQQVEALSSDKEDLSEDDSEDSERFEEKEEEADENKENNESESSSTDKKSCQEKNLEVIFDNKNVFNNETSSHVRRQRIEEFLKSKRSKRNLEQDLALRGKFSETFDNVLNKEGIIRKTQLISEFEIMENILFQFQTGERIFLRKGLVNPALSSVTQDTLGSYLESLQPYFKIIRCFRDFDVEITESRYPEKCLDKSSSLPARAGKVDCDAKKKNIPNVLYMYNVALRKALEPFQNEIIEIVENMGNYTLIQMERKLQPYYQYLTSLYSVHKLATKELNTGCNWMSSVRVLAVLYNAIMDATSSKMSFLYLNIFLHCFQVYTNIIDSWVSFVNLNDPNDEFIVTKSESSGNCENKCSEYVMRPYKTEIEKFGVNKVLILDLISEKMIHVGQSLEVLRRLNRFVTATEDTPNGFSSYQLLVKKINEEIHALGKVESSHRNLKPPKKPKSIFTMKSIRFGLERDGGGGDSLEIESIFMEVSKEKEEKAYQESRPLQERTIDKNRNICGEFIKSMVRNPFFKMTFDNIGMKQVHKQLERAKQRQKEEVETLLVIQNPEDGKSGIYPLHKIVTEAFHEILEKRVSSACTMVKDIVLKECNLLTHLSLLRSILLFNDSYLIQPFILALYTQPIIWGSSYSMSLHLKECVRSFYKDYANGLCVVLTKNMSTKTEDILQVIDIITVEYEVKWPLTLIITPEGMKKYNEIFRFALKLKWAHWVVCGLHFQSKHESGSKSIRHRLQLLRFWLLSTLGRINNYFLAQVTSLDVRISLCNSLKDIIQGHSKFLDQIYHNCLLGNKFPEARKLILEKLIPLCMDLSSLGVYDLNDDKLSSMEKTFRSCQPLLSRLLSSLEK